MCGCKKFLREPVNAISHGAGVLGAMAALTLMVVYAALHADAWHVVSFSIFGGTLILMYASSCLYHALKISDRALMFFRRIDHIMIFMVIAGSYTPLCLVPLRGAWGWSLLGSVWAIAVAGIFIKIFFMGAPRWISTVIYLVMGWLCVIAVYPLVNNLEPGALMWLVAGGLFYSVGAVIYALKRPNPFPRILGFHEIWHCFVIFGSASHFWLSFKYLMYI
ncbi:PAQR family membrane homeostasis protein TrhA [Desulfobacter sp.]|uniref:PAQR family membrane homeostasis protein TrhA n=1 Tax=Desulfobacter sp. TaxID=2294 RepID=UPI003D1290E3